MSREHFWPDWAADLLPDSEGYEERRVTFTEKTKPVGIPYKRSLQGSAKSKRIRVVCEPCNNGWMSIIENNIRAILTPLIVGNPVALDMPMQQQLAIWIVLKVMVGEQNFPPDAVFSDAERAAFLNDRTIPSHVRIRLARCGASSWKSAYVRHSATVSLNTAPPPDTRRRNVQTTTFGIVGLLVHTSACSAQGVDLDNFITFGCATIKLWPVAGDLIVWPSTRVLTAKEAGQIATAFDTLWQSPHVHWRPHPA